MKQISVYLISVITQIWFWFYLAYLILDQHPNLDWWSVPFLVTAMLSTIFGSIFVMDWIDRKYWK